MLEIAKVIFSARSASMCQRKTSKTSRWKMETKAGEQRGPPGGGCPWVGRPPPTALANGQLGEAPSSCPHHESTCIFKL